MGTRGNVAAPDAFNQLVGRLDYSMFIVTAAAGGRRGGCLVGFASQVSIDPSLFLVCLSEKNHTYRVAQEAETLVVHFVPADAEELAELFGGRTGDEVDKFERCRWREGPGGAPVLCELGNWFAGRVLEQMPFGDHCGFVLEPVEIATGGELPTFQFHRAKRIDPGHEA